MLCSISGTVPKEPVVSKKSGHVFEKSLVTKIIKEIGLCPVTNEPLGLDDLIEVRSAMNAPVKAEGTASVPGLLSMLQSEWDATALEMYGLRKTLHETRQELSHSLYQLDAATRVVARVVRERDEYRKLAEEGGGVRGASAAPAAPAAAAGKTGTTPASPSDAGAPPKTKKAKTSSLPEQVSEDMLTTSKELMSRRKKREISPSVASPEDIQKFAVKGSYAVHDKRKGGGGILAMAGYAKGGDVVLTGGADGVAHVVDGATGECIATLKEGGHSKKITSVASVGGTGRCLTASSADGTVRLWDVQSSSCSSTIKDAGVLSVDVHPSGGFSNYFYSMSPNAWAMFDIQRGDCLVRVANPDAATTPYTAGALHPDGLVYATGGQNGIITVWESRSQSLAGTIARKDGDKNVIGEAVSAIAFSENGYHMASADGEGVKVWDLRKLSCIHQLSAPSATAVAYDHSGLFLGVGSANAVGIYGAKQKYEKLVTFDDLPKKGAHAVVFGDNARTVLVGASELRVYG